MNVNYTYNATVTRVYDGDTITVDIDCGFGIVKKNTILRLYGIDTPEIRGDERPDGLVSRDFLLTKIPVGSSIIIQTYKDTTGKYGRYLATIFKDGENLNSTLLTEGYAKKYEG